ncbi:hypothetical protein [Roseimaritima sediminicola]|uniref:hypothetical protein n=1 Tax=Roseimaritima sediminicola TaxID=2662066 RepID=UPI0012984FEC|nr:hypothetical protein [Roseimaritima sediminicola]
MVRENVDPNLLPGKKDPSPEQIRRRCQEVQRSWNRRTRMLRSGMTRAEVDRPFHWRVPQVLLSDLALTEEALSDPLSN